MTEWRPIEQVFPNTPQAYVTSPVSPPLPASAPSEIGMPAVGVHPGAYPAPLYAGFWKRLAAALIDGLLVNAGAFVAGFLWGFVAVVLGINDLAVIEFGGGIVGLLVGWMYYAAMESSSQQGTLGKMALGIKVTDIHGERISFGRATGRHFGKLISTLIFLVGYLMVAFTEKKQGLHDLMAGCLVVHK